MKLTKQRLKEIIKEELEVVLTDDEASELFGDQLQIEARSAAERGEEYEGALEDHPGTRRTKMVMKLEEMGEDRKSALVQLLRHVQFPERYLDMLERMILVLDAERERNFRDPYEDEQFEDPFNQDLEEVSSPNPTSRRAVDARRREKNRKREADPTYQKVKVATEKHLEKAAPKKER